MDVIEARYLLDDSDEAYRFDRVAPVGFIRLASGGAAVVMAQDVEVDDEPTEVFGAIIAAAAAQLPAMDPSAVTPRIVVYGHDEQFDTLKLVELTIDAPHPREIDEGTVAGAPE